MLATEEGASQWSCYSVLNVLYSFIQKSKINEYLVAQKKGLSQEDINDIVGEYGSKQLYRMLGYFSVVGLLRVHVLLGDYTLALKVMENVELNQKVSTRSSASSVPRSSTCRHHLHALLHVTSRRTTMSASAT